MVGVGAVFYVQIALEVLPNNPTSTHLREVITPVVYFLVLTSVIVHGVTIPIGKAGSRSMTLTRTLTFSRSNTTANEPGLDVGSDDRRGNLHDVSRLPPPILAGTGRLPVRDDVQEMSANRPKDVRFHGDATPVAAQE